MAGGGALNLSLLSRGVGEVQRNGHEKVEVFLEPEDYYNFRDVPHRYYFPPIKHKYTLVSDMPQLSSRDSRDHQEIHLPKTFTTRKGALLLFSEDLALRDSERDQQEPRSTQGRDISENASTSLNLKTVDDLAKSILSYGNNENNSVYMKFLHRKREKFQRQIRPGFSAKRYLATWTRSWDDNVLETVINKGYITERSLFQYNFVIPHLKRRIFHEDLSHYPPPYRLMRNMLMSPGSLSGYTFFRSVPESEDLLEEFGDRDIDRESMRSRPPTSIKVIRTRNGEQREVSYASLDKKSQEEVITDLLVKSAVHYALKKQQEYMTDDMEEMEAANANLQDASYSDSDRKVSSSLKTPVPQFDMKEAVESLLDSHRQLNFDADLPAIDNQSHSSDYGGSFKGAAIPVHSVKGHSAKTRSWPYGIDEAGKEYIGIAPVVSLREGSSSPSGSVTSLPQLPAIKKHPLTPIKDVSRETTSHNFQLPPIHGADGIPMVNVEPPTPQHSTLMKAAAEQDGRDIHVVPSTDDEDGEWKTAEKRHHLKRQRGDHSHHSSVESIPHSGVQSIPSKNRPHWKGSQQSLKSVGSRKGRVDFDKYTSSSSPARSETGSVIGDGSLKGSVICAPDGEIINVGGSVGRRQSDVASLQDVTLVSKRVGDGEVEESGGSDADEPEEWKESRRKVHTEIGVEVPDKKQRKDIEVSKELDPTASIHQWNYTSADQGKQLSHPSSVHSVSSSCINGASFEREMSEGMYQSDWEKITERPDEEAMAMLDSRAATLGAITTTNLTTEKGTPAHHPTETTAMSRESTDMTNTKLKPKSRSDECSTPSAGGASQTSLSEGTQSKRREGSRMSENPKSGNVETHQRRSSGQSKSDREDDSGLKRSKSCTEKEGFNQSRLSARSDNLSPRKSSGMSRSHNDGSHSRSSGRAVSRKQSRKESQLGEGDELEMMNRSPSSLVTDKSLKLNPKSKESTPRSLGKSEMKETDSVRIRKEKTPRSSVSLDAERSGSRISSRSRDYSESEDQDNTKDGQRESRRSSKGKSGESRSSDPLNGLTQHMISPRDGDNMNRLLPNINAHRRSTSDVSSRTSPILEEMVSPGGGLSHRSSSYHSDRTKSISRRKSLLEMSDGRRSSSQSTDISSKSSPNSKNLSGRREKLPPLALSDHRSLNGEDAEIVTPLWSQNDAVSARDAESDSQEDNNCHDRTLSRSPSQATGLTSMDLSENSLLSGSLQVTGLQMFVASAPPSVRTSRSSGIGEESSASEQMLVEALTEHAQKIAQSVLRHVESGVNLEADIRRAASLWAERHPKRDISRSQSVQEKPNTDAIEEIMRIHRTNSADATAADYREQIRRNLTTAVAKAAGLTPDSLPADAEISPELLEALANHSLTPEDIEIVHDEESGRSTLRSKSQLSKAMGGVVEGHLYVSPGGGEEPTVSIPSDRVSVKDVGEVDIISYGVPETGDLSDHDQKSKGSSKAPSVKDAETGAPGSSRKPSEGSHGLAEDDLAQAVKKLEEQKITDAEPPAAKTKSPEDAPSEHGSTKTGVSKVSQKSEDSKKSREGKKKPVALEDREEFVVGKVENKKELEKLYGPVDPPPPPKPSPPKPPTEKISPEVIVPKDEPTLQIGKESPQEVSKLDIPREPRAKTPQKVPSPSKVKPPTPRKEAPVPPKPAPPPPKVEQPPQPKNQLPPIQKETAPAKKEPMPSLKRQPSKADLKPPPKKTDEKKEKELSKELVMEKVKEVVSPVAELPPPGPPKPSTISVQPPMETTTRATTPSKPEPTVADEGRVDTKTALAKLYAQIPPPPPKKDVKGKPKAKPKVEKPLPPKKEVKKKEKKVKIKKEKVEKPPPPREPTPPPKPVAKATSPKQHSPEPIESPPASPDNKSEDMDFVFVRDTTQTPEVKKESPLPREPTSPSIPPPVEEADEADDDEDAGVKQISNKDARLAKRAAAAAKKREEVERRRREKEEDMRRQKDESERQEQLRREMEEERKRRDEERRLRKLRQEEERKKEEQAAVDRERRKQMEIEREKRAKEEYQRKLEEMRRKQAEEEERRLEAQLERQREEEERRLQEEEMMSKMAEQERLEYEQRKREEEELRRQREEEEKRRREEEAQRALEEAKRLAEEMARRQAELEARLRFNRDLQLESHGLTHTQDITRMFVFSYFELLQWLGLDIPEFELQKLTQFQ